MRCVLIERTARGAGAVSVVAITGGGALEAARELVRREIAVGEPMLARLRFEGEELDEILVCASSAEEVELHLHGSVPLVRAVLAHLERRPGTSVAAAPGEDSPLELRAAALAPHAASESGARILLDQARGALRAELARLPGLLPEARDASIDRMLERARAADFALARTTMVLAGPPNAGKSTLFNALLGRERAITHSGPGTTRDVLAEEARIGHWPVLLCDTAGLRALRRGEDPHGVEAEGQARALRLARSAEIALWLTSPDDAAAAPPPPGACWIRIGTQSDRGGTVEPRVSAKSDPEGARRVLEAVFRRAFALPEAPWIAGAPVPFVAALRADLALCRAPATRAQVAERLAPWLR